MTQVEKIKAEVERRIKENERVGFLNNANELASLLPFIESLDREQHQELDEAAEKCESYYDVGDEQGYLYTHKGDIADAFRAGARWIAEQVETYEVEVIKNGINGVCTIQHSVDSFKPGDKVIVQIRKKEE